MICVKSQKAIDLTFRYTTLPWLLLNGASGEINKILSKGLERSGRLEAAPINVGAEAASRVPANEFASRPMNIHRTSAGTRVTQRAARRLSCAD